MLNILLLDKYSLSAIIHNIEHNIDTVKDEIYCMVNLDDKQLQNIIPTYEICKMFKALTKRAQKIIKQNQISHHCKNDFLKQTEELNQNHGNICEQCKTN